MRGRGQLRPSQDSGLRMEPFPDLRAGRVGEAGSREKPRAGVPRLPAQVLTERPRPWGCELEAGGWTGDGEGRKKQRRLRRQTARETCDWARRPGASTEGGGERWADAHISGHGLRGSHAEAGRGR